MLSMKELLELSSGMNVEIIDNVDNKHYIINERGQSIEFDLDMLMSTNKELSEEFEELKRLAKIGLDITTPKKTIQDEYKRIMCVNGHNLPVIVKKNKMPNCPFCGQKLNWKK